MGGGGGGGRNGEDLSGRMRREVGRQLGAKAIASSAISPDTPVALDLWLRPAGGVAVTQPTAGHGGPGRVAAASSQVLQVPDGAGGGAAGGRRAAGGADHLELGGCLLRCCPPPQPRHTCSAQADTASDLGRHTKRHLDWDAACSLSAYACRNQCRDKFYRLTVLMWSRPHLSLGCQGLCDRDPLLSSRVKTGRWRP